VSVRQAVCFVPRIASLRREYRRKVRTIARGWRTLYFKSGLLDPRRYGAFSWVLASHKICRWLVPHAGVLALAALAWLGRDAGWARWVWAWVWVPGCVRGARLVVAGWPAAAESNRGARLPGDR